MVRRRVEDLSALSLQTGVRTTASIAFEKRFVVSSKSILAASRVLVPVVVQGLLDLDRQLRGIQLEFTQMGEACLSCDDEDFLHVVTGARKRFSTPARLLAELRQAQSLPKLDAALEFLHLCMKYNDDNFRASRPDVPPKML